jgi:drug/metabolite transporter (DMT)-like permease
VTHPTEPHPPLTELDAADARNRPGPDPVVGAGITLLGIFLMGAGGARDAHYVFDFGVLLAVVGAVTFVLFVALSAMKQRDRGESSG